MEIHIYRTVWMLRHGQESPDRPKPLGGHLTELGRTQAERARERLADVPFDRIVASTFRRATETAQIVAARHPGIEVEFTKELWECLPSIPPSQKEYLPDFSPDVLAQCQERLDRVYTRFFETETPETVLLVGHGTATRYLLRRVLGLPLDGWALFDLHNCSLSRVEWKTILGRQITDLNYADHLPPEMQTYV